MRLKTRHIQRVIAHKERSKGFERGLKTRHIQRVIAPVGLSPSKANGLKTRHIQRVIALDDVDKFFE